MATRMQQRRGTAAQWLSTNSGDGPILNAGEIGYETDTNKFKIGDGTNHWIDLEYFLDAAALGGSIDDYVPLTQKNAASGVAQLNADVNVMTKTAVEFEGATADAYETFLTVTDPTADRTITLPDASGTVQLRVTDVSDTEIGYLNGVTSAIQTQMDAKATLASPTFTGTVTLPSGTVTSTMILDGTIATADIADSAVTSAKIANDTIVDADINSAAAIAWTKIAPSSTVSSTELGYLDGVTSAIQTQMDAKAPLAAPAFTGTATAVNLTISGDLTVNGTTTNLNSTSLVVEDKNVVLGDTATPTDTTADGGGITLKGTTDKTFNWVDSTDAWTSSEHINLASGKTLKYNGTDLVAAQSGNSGKYLTTDGTSTSWGTISGYSAPTLGSTSIASGATVTTITGLTLSGATLTGSLTAASSAGTSGQVLSSTGTGVQWITPAAGAAFSELMLIGA